MRFEQRLKGVTLEIWGRDSQEGEEPVQIPRATQAWRGGCRAAGREESGEEMRMRRGER